MKGLILITLVAGSLLASCASSDYTCQQKELESQMFWQNLDNEHKMRQQRLMNQADQLRMQADMQRQQQIMQQQMEQQRQQMEYQRMLQEQQMRNQQFYNYNRGY